METSKPPRRISRLWILMPGAALLLLMLFSGLYWLFVHSPRLAIDRGFDAAKQIARELAAALPFEPVVRERTILVFEPPQDRADWLAVEESFLVRHEFEHSFLGSVKRFDVEAVARVGMGFSFSEDWNMRLEPASGRALISLPEPRVLFVEVADVRIRRDEDGWWNHLTAADREAALRRLEENARTNFDKEALAERARSSLLQVFNRVLRDHGYVAEAEEPRDLSPLPR